MKIFQSLVAMMIIAAVTFPDAAQSAEKPTPMIRVTGEGTISLKPDLAIVTLSVVREADTARKALSANNSAMAGVLSEMKNGGIEERDLQTSNFRIDPRYTKSNSSIKSGGSPRIDGYRVSNSLTVRVRDLSILGAILDKSVSLGVNQGGGIVFTNDDPSEALTKARIAAMKDALSRAATLVDAAGIGLGPIIEISEQSFQPSPVPIARARTMAFESAESVPVAGGENEYRVSVNVAIELKQ